MAIRYNKAYNKEIRDVVRHFNSVRKTLSKKGIKLASAPIKVSELKARYQTRRDLNKELALLNKISSRSDSLLREVETTGGVTAIKWNLDYLKLNQKKAIEFFEHEKELELAKDPKYPHEFIRLNDIEAALNTLNLNLDYMNQEEFKSAQAYVREYTRTMEHMVNGYKGFMWQVENAMKMTGFSNEQINSFFEKFKVLNPSEFHDLYSNNGLVQRIYELVNSTPNGNPMKLTLSEEDAEDLLNTLIEEIDVDIAQVKNK